MLNKEEFCVTADYTLLEVMEVIERNKERAVVVVGNNGKVCGFVSQGDIIKALIVGKSIHSKIDKIISSSFIYLKDKNYERALDFFKNRNLSIIPVINDDQELIDIISSKDMFAHVELAKDI